MMWRARARKKKLVSSASVSRSRALLHHHHNNNNNNNQQPTTNKMMLCVNVHRYAPGVRADKTGKSMDQKLNIDSKTRDIELGSCPCIDPCSMYVLTARASVLSSRTWHDARMK
jgi:hypothetical protein